MTSPGPPALDLLVLGSGVAGLSAAIRAAGDPGMRVGVLTKAELSQSATRRAHAGGAATGAEIERALVEAVRQTAAAVMEGWFALDLLVEAGRARGVRAVDPEGTAHDIRCPHVLMATGGAGQLFAVTTNPPQAT